MGSTGISSSVLDCVCFLLFFGLAILRGGEEEEEEGGGEGGRKGRRRIKEL